MKKLHLVTVGAFALIMSLVTSSSVQAVTIGGFNFTGTMVTSVGLYYKGPPPIGGPNAAGAAWNISSNIACQGVEVSAKKGGVGGPACSLNLNGNFNSGLLNNGAYCVASGGQGAGSLIIGSNVFHIPSIGWLQSIAGQYFLTGTIVKPSTGQQGTIFIDFQAVPDATAGESCLGTGPGADRFIVTGIGGFDAI